MPSKIHLVHHLNQIQRIIHNTEIEAGSMAVECEEIEMEIVEMTKEIEILEIAKMIEGIEIILIVKMTEDQVIGMTE